MNSPTYVDTPARSLVGERMLIIETHETWDNDKLAQSQTTLRVHARLKRKRHRHVCFKAGVVVRQQLEQQRFFPVWARLTLVQGKAHEYYILDLACTTTVHGDTNGRYWEVNYDPETNRWHPHPETKPWNPTQQL
jgi:hypothetical protein